MMYSAIANHRSSFRAAASKRVFSDFEPEAAKSGMLTMTTVSDDEDDEGEYQKNCRSQPDAKRSRPSSISFTYSDNNNSKVQASVYPDASVSSGLSPQDGYEKEPHEEHWHNIPNERRNVLVRVAHRSHEGPVKRMNAWDGLVGVLQRHYTLISSGAVKVGDTSGCLHYDSSTAMASRPSCTMLDTNYKVNNPLVATGGDLTISREDFVSTETTSSSVASNKLMTNDGTGLFRCAVNDALLKPFSEKSVGNWAADEVLDSNEMPLTFGQPQGDNKNSVLPSSRQGQEGGRKNDYTQNDTCDALLMYEGGSEYAV
eukprot:scaffold2849_cov174-Amphora_coffeaeformis.AAC.21